GQSRCPPEEPQWLAPACEWDGIASWLSAAVAEGVAGRHPRSEEWESVHGRTIPGDSCADQYATVSGWHDRAWNQDARRRALTIWGHGSPSAIEDAVGSRTSSPRWRDRAGQVLDEAFDLPGWVLRYLAPRTAADEGSGGR
ncbi:MAG: hypothetical protein J2P25_19750, partial [Nocardiopsaceae bacterium]|nr:hypothetical protein [Nocardiopsaceae bacterium]